MYYNDLHKHYQLLNPPDLAVKCIGVWYQIPRCASICIHSVHAVQVLCIGLFDASAVWCILSRQPGNQSAIQNDSLCQAVA